MSTSASPEPGKIITFYSYKGGTGRSMALTNMAWILASNGFRVLAVDWDMEAPGLHRYFAPFLLDPELVDSEGVLDMVSDYVTAAMTPSDPASPADMARPTGTKWYEPFANVLRYATSLDWKFPEYAGRKGWIDLVPAGKQGPGYATRMNSFSWQNFYDKLGGGGFVEALKRRMRAEYDYILIDSRTGMSDTSGICTVHLPDVLVVCFTMNRQSIEGASAVAASAYAQRRDSSGNSTLHVFPVPARVEKAEKEKLDVARETARNAFAPFLEHLSDVERDSYWGDVEVLYEPFYAYEEILAPFGDAPLQSTSILASMERITGWVTGGKVTQLAPMDEALRKRHLAKFTRQSAEERAKATRVERDYLFYVSYAMPDRDDFMEQFIEDLRREVRLLTGARSPVDFVDLLDMARGVDWNAQLMEALSRSRVLVPLYSPALFESASAGKEFQYFLQRHFPILPILWVEFVKQPPAAAAEIAWTNPDYPDIYQKLGLRALMRLSRYEDEYRKFMRQFALHLVDLARLAPALTPDSLSLSDLPNAFASGSTAPGTVAVPEPAPAPTDARIEEFAASIPRLDRQDIIDRTESELIPHIRQRADPFPLRTGRTILQHLRRRHLYDLMERVANEMIVGGQDAPVIRLSYARALIDEGKTTAALAVLKELAGPEIDKNMWNEISGLFGRAYKQLYIEADAPALPRNQQNLALAFKAYAEPYSLDEHLLWHGINAVALAQRAARDRVRLASLPMPDFPVIVAHKLLVAVEERVSNADAQSWDYAVAAEACLALGDADGMMKWTLSYVQEPSVDAYELSSFLRQLTDVWQLLPAEGIGQTILPLLQAEILRREGGSITVEARSAYVPTLPERETLEANFGSSAFKSLDWYRVGMDRSRGVARITTAAGEPLGTGFLLRGSDLSAKFGPDPVLLTAAHVVGANAPSSIFEDSVRVSSEGFGVVYEGVEVLFSSPTLDFTLGRPLKGFLPSLESYPIAPSVPVPDGRNRVYLIGYPRGHGLSFSMNDNLLLDHENPYIHYRAPTEAGSSGSPVFDEEWRLIGVHHRGGQNIPRLHGRAGTYEANEAIWIGAILQALREALG
jgi:MinD-like ATPase involved in chromosome partitioning or flagellar assembly